MKIYIPSHLRHLKIVNQMCKMIEKYQETGYYEEYIDPYEYYYSSVSNDPVKKFIGICLSNRFTTIEVSENIVNYLTKLFYSIKGCGDKIIDYLKTHIGLDISSYEIKTEESSINLYLELASIPEVLDNNEELFMKLFDDFLKSLMLLDSTNIVIKTLELTISDSISVTVQSGIKVFNAIKVKVNEENTITI